jgi:hypothetical protein
MSPLEILQIIAGLFVLFFLPGYTFTIALFPRKGELDKEYDGLYKVSMGVAMSIVLVILTGFGLNSLGVYRTSTGDYMGYVQAHFLLAAFLGESALFFLIGWYRGGFPFMGRLHPKLARMPRPEPGMIEVPPDREKYLSGLDRLGRHREKVKKEITDCERREKLGTGKMREYYRKKVDDKQKELRVINEEIEKVEQKISEGIY